MPREAIAAHLKFRTKSLSALSLSSWRCNDTPPKIEAENVKETVKILYRPLVIFFSYFPWCPILGNIFELFWWAFSCRWRLFILHYINLPISKNTVKNEPWDSIFIYFCSATVSYSWAMRAPLFLFSLLPHMLWLSRILWETNACVGLPGSKLSWKDSFETLLCTTSARSFPVANYLEKIISDG